VSTSAKGGLKSRQKSKPGYRAPWLAVVPVETLLELLRYKLEPEVLP